MEYIDYYKIMGVDRNADENTIRRAYRKLAKKYHPDKNPGNKQSEEKFKAINEAYEVLGDPQKRAKYDRLSDSYRTRQSRGGAAQGFDWSQWTGAAPGGTRVRVDNLGDIGDVFGGSFSDFFNAVFGGATRSRTDFRSGIRRRGRDIEQPVTVSLKEAYTGTTRTFNRGGLRIEVKIPQGARTGTKVRVSGQGESGLDQPGDLYIIIRVEPDSNFRRKGNNLTTDVHVDLFTAVLGGEVRVPTMGQSILLSIPPGSQPEQKFRVRDRGMPNLHNPSQHGDLYVRLNIDIPRKLSDKERGLFEQLAKLHRKHR
jgi:curved DNA-binding protein